MIPLLQPSCTEAEIEAVTKVLRSHWWGAGPVCEEVEAFLSDYYDYAYCVTTNSCTAALHLTMLANDVGPGDEVIVPALTFISTALAVSYVGATPVFADIDARTLCIDIADVRKKMTRKTKAIIAVDYAGYPALPVDARCEVPIIQDAAHSCGGEAYGSEVCFSFHPVKNIATGDGGAILTRDEKRAARMRALRWCGINKSTWERTATRYGWDYDISELGFKCHWNDLQAAIGLVQLHRMEELLARRRAIAKMYSEGLLGCCQLPLQHWKHTWHLYPIRVDARQRNKVVKYLLSKGISAGVHYKPLTSYPMYQQRTPTVTEYTWRRLVSLPIFYDMTDDQVQLVISTLREVLDG